MLSCSTTFELGVDVGELQAVLLRNMPPTTANYIQRAGRAGRRSGTAALVVTYAQRRSHDLSRYAEPETMLTGAGPGALRAARQPADRPAARALGGARGVLPRRQGQRRPGVEDRRRLLPARARSRVTSRRAARSRGFLDPGARPRSTRRLRARAALSPSWPQIGLDRRTLGGPAVQAAGPGPRRARPRCRDVRGAPDGGVRARRSDLAARFERSINTITRRSLIGFLANRNILPKYGFPVDTVELRTAHCDSQVGARLELTRDLSVAIHEYAPGSELVAGGVLWRSAGIYRLPGRELITRSYTVCRGCQHYREGGDDLEPACSACGRPADGPVREYCVPEFGFVADPRTGKPGTVPPQRSWNGAVHVVSLGAELAETRWQARTGALAWCHSGTRGRLVALAEGPGGAGFLICDWCGWGGAQPRPRAQVPRQPAARQAVHRPAALALARAHLRDRHPAAAARRSRARAPWRSGSGTRCSTRCSRAPPRAWRSAAATSTASCTRAPTAAAAWCCSTPSPAERAACCGSPSALDRLPRRAAAGRRVRLRPGDLLLRLPAHAGQRAPPRGPQPRRRPYRPGLTQRAAAGRAGVTSRCPARVTTGRSENSRAFGRSDDGISPASARAGPWFR